jgi:hypothetical protein
MIKLKQKRHEPADFESKVNSRLIEWIALFYVKHSALESSDVADFEKQFLTKVRIFLLLISGGTYWNLFLGNKLEYMIENSPSEMLIEYEFEFPNYKAKKQKKRFLIFQKKGVNPPLFK